MSDVKAESILENKLQNLECHFTWGLNQEDADLNLLEVKLCETLDAVQQEGSEGNLERHSFNLLAYTKHLRGDNNGAMTYLEKVEKQNKDNENFCVVIYGNLAWLLHHEGDDMKSMAYINKIDKIQQTSPPASISVLPREIYSEKAWSFLRFSKKHYKRAMEYFSDAVEREPEDKEWNLGYAFSLFRLEGLETREDKRLSYENSPAVRQLKKALVLNPESAIIQVYLGLKCYKNQRNAEAWGHIRKALGLAPYNLSVVLQVGKFMKKEQHYLEALAVLKEMLTKTPNSSRLHNEIANNYRWRACQTGNPHDHALLQRCVHHLEEGARLNPTHIYPQIELAARYAELMDARKAEEKFQELWTNPDLTTEDKQAWHRIYGDFQLYRLGSERKAVGHYKEGMRLENISTEWRQCRGRLLKVLSFSRGRDDPYQIKEFIDSFKRGAGIKSGHKPVSL
ncbi:interferon-induced protein with tetratricopeptide repeats 8 [Polymixia lowei]